MDLLNLATLKYFVAMQIWIQHHWLYDNQVVSACRIWEQWVYEENIYNDSPAVSMLRTWELVSRKSEYNEQFNSLTKWKVGSAGNLSFYCDHNIRLTCLVFELALVCHQYYVLPNKDDSHRGRESVARRRCWWLYWIVLTIGMKDRRILKFSSIKLIHTRARSCCLNVL